MRKSPAGYKLVEDELFQCTATAKSTRQRCRREAMHGSNVCVKHGGGTPQVRKASERRVSEHKAKNSAARFLAKQGYEDIEDPFTELMRLASEQTAYRDIFRSQVDALLLADEVRYEHRAGEQLRAEMALWERASERCLKIYSEISRLGIAERQIRIREAEIVLMAQAIRNILGRLELNKSQQAVAGKIVAEELRAIENPQEN